MVSRYYDQSTQLVGCLGDTEVRYIKTDCISEPTITPGKVYTATPSLYRMVRITNDTGEEIVVTIGVPCHHLNDKGVFVECDERGNLKRVPR
jgi:hypothetical protein